MHIDHCRHFYICHGNDPPVRHGCPEAFNKITGTCDSKRNVPDCQNVSTADESFRKKVRKRNKAKNANIFIEFVEFLINRGLFNEKVFQYMVANQDFFE